MQIEEEKVLCGGCKSLVDAVTMSVAEIAATFDYDFNAPLSITPPSDASTVK
jgi:hypothetical protein